MEKWKKNLSVSLILLLFSIVNYFYASATIKPDVNVPFLARADVYLKIWVILLGVLSLVLAIRTFLQRNKEKETVEPVFSKSAVLILAAVAGYLFVMDKIGFVISTTAFLLLTILILSKKPGEKTEPKVQMQKMLFWIVLSLSLTLGIYCLFNGVLGVSLQIGRAHV